MRRRELAAVIGLTVAYGLFEGVGISLLLPVLQYIESGPEAVREFSGVLGSMVAALEGLGLRITLSTLLLAAFAPILLRQLVYFFYSWYAASVTRRAAVRLRGDSFSSIVHGDLSYVVAESEGKLISILTQQVSRGTNVVLQFGQLVGAAALLVVYVAILLVLQWQLALVTVVAMAGISVMVKGSIARSRRYGQEVAERGNLTYAFIGERISALRLIKMRGQEDVETQRVVDVSRRFEQSNVRITISKAAVEVTVDPMLMLAVFVIIYFGVEYLQTTLSSLGVFLFVLLRLNQQSKLFNVSRQAVAGYIDSLESVLSTVRGAKASRQIVGGDMPYRGLQSAIDLEHVGFAYADDGGAQSRVLDDVSLTIPAGSLTAFVGRSGSGKSTLADLVPHLRDATDGRVLIDGVPIAQYDLRSLRRKIGFMSQEAMLFNDTIRNNLEYGLEYEPSEEQVASALDHAYCTAFVAELAEGLDTVVGDRGVRLSGGQRQRLALARVLLQDPDILILDEPTSALDSESERYIQKALDEMRGQRTLIVIAHRLSTVQRADQIYVLEGGRIVEQGAHEELIARDGAYRKLFELQIHT